MKVNPIKDTYIVREIIDYLKEEAQYRNLVLFATGIYTGLRVSDILKLKVKDVKNVDILKLKEQKNKSYRAIKLHKELKKIYKDFLKEKDDNEFLIKSRKGKNKAIGRKQAYKILRSIGKDFNLNSLGTHTMRKTYGYNIYIASGKNIGLTQAALNHKDAEHTLRYIGVTQMEVDKITCKLDYN